MRKKARGNRNRKNLFRYPSRGLINLLAAASLCCTSPESLPALPQRRSLPLLHVPCRPIPRVSRLPAGIGESLVFIEFPRFGLLSAILPRRHRNTVIVHVRRYCQYLSSSPPPTENLPFHSPWVLARWELVSAGADIRTVMMVTATIGLLAALSVTCARQVAESEAFGTLRRRGFAREDRSRANQSQGRQHAQVSANRHSREFSRRAHFTLSTRF